MKKSAPQLLKGFRDYLPQEQIARRKIINKISEVYERYGFEPIETPALESFDLLKGMIGEEEKLIYKFEDNGGREVALRYDLTLPLARIIANNPELPKPFKRYQIGSSYRAENTQKGRFREFTQCDIDIVGINSIIADAEIIASMATAYKALEIGEVEVKINNRQIIDKVLSEMKISKAKIGTFMRLLDKLDKIGVKNVKTALKEEGFDENILEDYEKAVKKQSEPFRNEMQNLLEGLGVANITFDPFLARGLDYYTGIIFEFVLKDRPDFGSVGGGGRYDNLIGRISGTNVPAVGGSIGLDRMFAALQDQGVIAPQTAAEVIILNIDKSLTADYLNIATNLRTAGIDTEFYFETSKIDKQFKYAEKKNIKLAIIYGTDEAKKKKVNIKDLEQKKQTTADLDDLVTQVKSMLW
jgi:histidyl-tRNA synthetase